MQRRSFVAQDATGKVLPAATVYVYRADTTTQVTVYSDDGATAITQPITADSFGRFSFFAPGGEYDIAVTYRGNTVTVEDVEFDGGSATYTSRTALAAAWYDGMLADGSIVSDGTVQYKASAGATEIEDLTGLVPYAQVYLNHFATNAVPGTTVLTTAAQTAINYLPARGGDIWVTGGSHNINPASLTVPDRKMIRWVLEGDATLPADMPGVVITSGNSEQPHEGGLGASTRPGASHMSYIARHEIQDDQANQQDSIVYIEGEAVPPSAGSGLTTEFAGVRVNMRMENGTEAGAGIRGYHATVTGDGGNAKLRAIRVTSIGLDGHDGLVNGATISAVRTGIIPTSAGGNGVDEYASGDVGPYPNEDSVLALAVGPGIRRCLVLEGQAGKERPQFGILQKLGNQALLPENAFIFAHGGGNGAVMQIARDENSAGDIVAQWDNDGQLFSGAYRSMLSIPTLLDDTAATYPLERSGGHLSIYSPGSSTIRALCYFRAVTSSEVLVSISNGVDVEFTTGSLTGTTGTDGKVTLSISGQNLVIENRMGVSRQFVWTVF